MTALTIFATFGLIVCAVWAACLWVLLSVHRINGGRDE